MTLLQIIAVCLLGAGTVVALGFTVAFIVVCVKKDKPVEEVKKVEDKEEVSEIDLNAMLAQLEEASKNAKEEPKEEAKEEPVVVVREVVEEPKAEEPKEEIQEVQPAEQVSEQEMGEEEVVVEEIKEVKEVKGEQATTALEVIVVTEKAEPEFDYRVRLEKIKESQARIDRDLEKTTRAIMKYERTIRRKDRNQKMLDRRALELTNLNLLMYSVTDIKNVDAEKKTRQEELTAHIAELKASIQDAENYLETNKEKHENNLKLRDYLSHEKTRYADEVKELEALIASGKYFDDNAGGDNK